MKRSKLRKKTKGWVATQGRKGFRSAGSSPWPTYGSFKTPLPKVVEIPSKGTPRNKIKNGGRAMANYNLIGVHDLENAHTPAFASLLQQVLFATPRVRDIGALGSQAALSPLSLNALDGRTLAYRPLQPAPSAGVKHLVVRLSSLKTPTASLRNSIIEKHEESVKETESQNASGIVIWSNAAFCPDSSSDNGSNSIVVKSNFHQSQANPLAAADYEVAKGPSVRGNGDGLQDVLAQNIEKIAGGAVLKATSGATEMLPRIDENCSRLESIGGHVMSGCAGSSSLVSPRMKSASVVPQPRRRPTMMTVSSPAVNRSITSSAATSEVGGGSRCDRYQMESASSVWCTQSETEPTSESREAPASGQKRRKGRKLLESGTRKPGPLQNWHRDENKDLQEMQASKPVLCSTNERQPLDMHLWPPFDKLIFPGQWIRKGGKQTSDAVPRNRRDYQNHQAPSSGPNLTTDGKVVKVVEQFKHHEKTQRGDQGGMPQPISPPILLKVKTCSSNGEADLDAEIQRQLEDEIAREILVLSQKLANLQTRYGVRRLVQSSSKPACLSCPQTPLLLEISLQKDGKEDSLNTSRSMTSEAISYTQKGRSKLYSIKSHDSHAVSRIHLEERKAESRKCLSNSGAVGASGQIPRRGNNTGTATFASSNKHPNSNGLSNTAVHASFTRGNATSNSRHGIPRQGNDHTQFHGKTQTAEASLEDSLNSKSWNFASSFRRGGAGKPIDELKDNILYLDDVSKDMAARYPNSNKRFDWVKMLRSSGIGLHGSSERAEYLVSPNDASASEKECSGIDAARKNVRELANVWSGDDCDTVDYSGVSTTSASKSVQASGMSPTAAATDAQEHGVALVLENQDDHDGNCSRVKRGPESSLEHRAMKSGKKSASPSDDMGALDSRTALHLLKAGLRRVPSFRKTPVSSPFPSNLRSKSKSLGSRNSKKDGGKRLKNRCRGDLPKKPVLAKKAEDERVNDTRMMEDIPESEELRKTEEAKQKAAEWQKPETGNYEAEYETFVEASDESRHSCEVVDACREPLGVSGGQSEDKDSKQSPSSISTQEKRTLSEAPVVSLVNIPRSTKKTFIRCIELVGAIRNKELPNASQLKSQKIGDSPFEGAWPRRRNGRVEKTFGKLMKGRDDSKCVHNKGRCQKTQSVVDQLMARKRHGYEENAVCRFLSKEVVIERVLASVVARESAEAVRGPKVPFDKRADKGQRICNEDIFPQRGDGQCDASQPVISESRSSCTTFPTSKRAETVTACPPVGMNPLKFPISPLSRGAVSLILEENLARKVEHLTASVRARWEELTDALEKERLGLPKIRTGSSDAAVILTTSPRDSGCVKRIAEQIKTMECFNLEGIGAPALVDKGIQSGNVEEASLNKCQHWWKIQQKQAVVF